MKTRFIAIQAAFSCSLFLTTPLGLAQSVVAAEVGTKPHAEASIHSGALSSPATEEPTKPRFEILANGEEVLDRRAKLIWRRCVEGMRWTGTTCWGVAARFEFVAAQTRATQVGKETKQPWRLPHIPELRLLVQKPQTERATSGVDRGKRLPWVDPDWFPGTPADWHWTQSSTVLGGNINIYNYGNVMSGTTPTNVSRLAPRTGWAFNFATGEPAGDISRQNDLVVRLVRGASL
jgi:hypothetical protein